MTGTVIGDVRPHGSRDTTPLTGDKWSIDKYLWRLLQQGRGTQCGGKIQRNARAGKGTKAAVDTGSSGKSHLETAAVRPLHQGAGRADATAEAASGAGLRFDRHLCVRDKLDIDGVGRGLW